MKRSVENPENDGRRRVAIEGVEPEIDGGRFPVKRVEGENVVVRADFIADGHSLIGGRLLFRERGKKEWKHAAMRLLENDRWEGTFTPAAVGHYEYTLEAWVDPFKTWQADLRKKVEAGLDVRIDFLAGAELLEAGAKGAPAGDSARMSEYARLLRKPDGGADVLSAGLEEEPALLMEKWIPRDGIFRYEKRLAVEVDRRRALFSSWYEMFPRSASPVPGKHGTFGDCERLLPDISAMGFDVLYFPPIHPIGKSKRKGKNNAPVAGPGEPGSPWAIGSNEGGHTAVHSQLGTVKDFERLVRKAREHGMEIALDLAFQCSPDHPYVTEHPRWFLWRPDGTIQFAENPPKKYEDIIPFNFETEDFRALWEELKGVVVTWIERGVRIFRVDNPHTKPFRFWEWLIGEIKKEHPDVLFLSEAFTRPKVMYRLAKAGFSQSYTYFTWRTSKEELTTYLEELTREAPVDFFRPNFWPNTPDILPEHLQTGGRPAFLTRLVLAATLSSNYGIYGPPFELCLDRSRPDAPEYLDNEKYEIRHWNRNEPGNLKDFITRVNRIRRENPALQETRNLNFCELPNDRLLAYEKSTAGLSNVVLVIVNLDSFHTQSGWVRVPLERWGMNASRSYLVHDLLNGEKYVWQGEWNYVELNPQTRPAHIFLVQTQTDRETGFDQYM